MPAFSPASAANSRAVRPLSFQRCTRFAQSARADRAIRHLLDAKLYANPETLSATRLAERIRIDEYGAAARQRLRPHFERARVPYPPSRFALVGLKAEKRLELYAAGDADEFRLIRAYPILAASGVAGPKLREGDRQVPEGVYRIESLNPNSRYHLSLRLNYPNPTDRERAAVDGRTDLGGDIMIHGSDVSIGCLAMGDPAAEELFVLAADAGWSSAKVVIAPFDLRERPPPVDSVSVPWAAELYAEIGDALGPFPAPSSRGGPTTR